MRDYRGQYSCGLSDHSTHQIQLYRVINSVGNDCCVKSCQQWVDGWRGYGWKGPAVLACPQCSEIH